MPSRSRAAQRIPIFRTFDMPIALSTSKGAKIVQACAEGEEMTNGNRTLLLGVMIVALLSGAMPARAGTTPTEEVQETIGRIVGVLQDPMVADGAAVAKRKAVFREVLAARFDFKEMAKRSLGNHWQSVAARQQEFVSVFTSFIERVYVGKIDSLKDTKIAFVRERIEGGVAQVDTQIVPAKGDDFPMNYRLHLVGGKC